MRHLRIRTRERIGRWLGIVMGCVLSGAIASEATALSVNNVHSAASGSRTQIRMEIDVRNQSNKVDLLIVIDDSGSMAQHQANLAQNVDRMTSAAAKLGADLHVGVLTTSVEGFPLPVPAGHLVGVNQVFARGSDLDFETTLRENLRKAMTTNGSGQEQPFASILASLQPAVRDGVNKGFRRPDAGLAILLVTDADDQSTTVPVADFVSALRAEVGPTGGLGLHAAFIPAADTKCDRAGEPTPIKIEEAMDLIGGGRVASLCDPAFGDALEAVGVKMGQGAAREIQLPLPADYSTLKLTYGARQLMAGNLQLGFGFDRVRHRVILGTRALSPLEPVGVPLVIEYWTK